VTTVRHPELVFVVGVSSFTRKGFVGSASFKGEPVDIEFDDRDAGVFLSAEMCREIHVKKGSRVSMAVDVDARPGVAESVIEGVTAKPRISNTKVYYDVGRMGGAIIRIWKA